MPSKIAKLPVCESGNPIQDSAPIGILPDRPPLALPHVPSVLALGLQWITDPHPDIPVNPDSLEALRPMARRALDDLAPLMRPAAPNVLTAWLWPINGAVEFPLSENDFRRRVASLVLASESIPWPAWNRHSQRRGLALWHTPPSVAAIVEMVTRDVDALIERHAALFAIANPVDGAG